MTEFFSHQAQFCLSLFLCTLFSPNSTVYIVWYVIFRAVEEVSIEAVKKLSCFWRKIWKMIIACGCQYESMQHVVDKSTSVSSVFRCDMRYFIGMMLLDQFSLDIDIRRYIIVIEKSKINDEGEFDMKRKEWGNILWWILRRTNRFPFTCPRKHISTTKIDASTWYALCSTKDYIKRIIQTELESNPYLPIVGWIFYQLNYPFSLLVMKITTHRTSKSITQDINKK